jgi:predicted secreted protein
MILPNYNKGNLLSTFCILSITFLIACLSITIQKYQIALGELQTQPRPLLEILKNIRNNITETTTNCTNSVMENNMTVKKGEEFVLTCKANRTAGYTLIPEFNKDIISLIEKKFQASSSRFLGAPGAYIFTFKALKHGSDHLKILTKSAQDKGAIIDQKAYSIIVE